MKTTVTLIIAGCLLLALPGRGFTGTLPLPEAAKSIRSHISSQCDGCLERGFSPTGSGNIGFGKNFFPNFFQGTPARGMLVGYIMPGKDYIKVIRENELQQAKKILHNAFSRTGLFVVEKEGFRVHSVLQPREVDVTITDKLHRCLNGTNRQLCCCCTTDCADECCEKRLGSTSVTIRWDDPMQTSQTIEYTWYPHAGASKIRTITADGRRTQIRWCLDSAGPGFLQ